MWLFDKNEMGGTCSTCGGELEMHNRVLESKLEWWRSHGRPVNVWEDNIKMDLQDIIVWTGLIWLRMGTSGRLL